MDARARFEAIFRTHGGAVRAYARRRTDPQTADDVVADVFVVAWRRLEDVPDEPLPWLLGVARRLVANHHRGWARDQALRSRVMSEQTRGSHGSSAHDASQAVLLALSRLSERDRETLLLVGWEGLDAAQAARALGVSPNTFAARLYRARRRFARALAECGETTRSGRTVRAEVLR